MRRLWILSGILIVAALTLYACRMRAADTSSGEHDASDSPRMPADPHYAGKFSFLALGDSYTIGESVEPKDRWPVQLAAMMRATGVDLSDPQIIAVTGWTTGDLLAVMNRTKLADRYDLVMLLIGVNNQFQHRPLAEYRNQFSELLSRAIRLAGGNKNHVVVLSFSDWGVTTFGQQVENDDVSADVDRFNAANLELSKQADVKYVDITPISRQMADHPGALADDGLHPSAEQYTAWAKLALPAVQAAFR